MRATAHTPPSTRKRSHGSSMSSSSSASSLSISSSQLQVQVEAREQESSMMTRLKQRKSGIHENASSKLTTPPSSSVVSPPSTSPSALSSLPAAHSRLLTKLRTLEYFINKQQFVGCVQARLRTTDLESELTALYSSLSSHLPPAQLSRFQQQYEQLTPHQDTHKRPFKCSACNNDNPFSCICLSCGTVSLSSPFSVNVVNWHDV